MAERVSSNPDYKKTTVKTVAIETAVRHADEIVYLPTHNEKSCKAEFWVKWNDGPTRSTDKISVTAVAQVLGRQTVNKSWSKPGFKEWFLNKDEFRIKVEQLSMMAVGELQSLMADEKSDVRLKAATKVLELANKFTPKKQEVIVADAAIQKMDIPELKEFIRRNRDTFQAILEGTDED